MGNQQAKPSSPSTTTNHSPITKALQQRYLENFSTIHRAMGETQDLHDCYINLALIKESKEEEKKQLSERGAGKEHGTGEEKGMRDELLSSFESIHSKKEALALENLFRRMPDDAEEPEKILILGRAGIGKTILASYLAHEWALADTKLPPLNTTSTAHSGGGSSSSRGPSSMRPSSVAKGPNPALLNELKRFDAVFFIPLRGLINEVDLSLSGVIRKHCLGDIEELRPSIAEIIDYLRTVQNNCLWILDGYDEVEQWIRESANPKPWENFLQGVFSCRHVIMTSRPHAVPPNTGIVTINIAGLSCRFNRALENVGFTNENIEAYVRKILPRQAGEAKLAKLKSNPNIWGIAHIPINLDILCSTEVEANTMSQLYQQLVKVFLDRFKKTADGQKHVYNISLIIKALKKLAYVAMAKSQILLDPALQKEALPLSEFPPNILDDMLQTGLLKRSADRSVYFIHLTFQEFFAAEFLATKFIENKQGLAPTFLPASATTTPTASGSSNTSASNSIAAFPQTAAEFIAKEKYNSRCEVVLWFLAGILYQPQETSQDATALWRFFNIIESHPRDLIGMHHVSLLVRLLDECEGGEKLAFYEELMGNVMPCLEVWGNSNFPREVPMQRSLAASALIQRGHKMTNFWLQFLAKPAIKQSAIQSLGDIGLLVDSSIISALLQDLRDKDSWYVRASAAGALGKLGQGGNQAVIDALLQALRNTDNYVRARAAEALVKLGQGGNQAVIDALLQALRDKEYYVRASAAEALGKFSPNIVLSLLSNPAAISQIKASAQALQLPVIVYDAYLSQCPFGLRTLLPAPATPTSSTATTSSAPTSTPESLVTLQTVAHGISKLQQGQEKIQSQLEQVEKVNVEVKKEVGSVGIQTRMLNVKTDLSLDLQNNREAAAVATLLNPVIVPEEDLPVLTSVSNLSSTLSSVGVFATTSSAPTSTPSTQSNTESSFSTTSSMSKT